VEPGRVRADTLRRCVAIAVTGSVLVMAGVTLGFAARAVGLPAGWPAAGVVAWGLIAAGVFCAVLLIAASGPAARTGRGGTRVPRRAAPRHRPAGVSRPVRHARYRQAPVPGDAAGQPGTSEEWIRALRPDAPPPRR
jgi:hypothetical protein